MEQTDRAGNKENNEMSASPPVRRVGLLFIHGIGQQRRGETLLQWGDCLIEWLKKWIDGALELPLPLFQRNYQDTFGLSPLKERSLELQGVDWLPQTDGAPSHGKLLVSLTREDGTIDSEEWIIAESHWADSFPPPTASEVLRWGFNIFPWILVTELIQFVFRFSTPIVDWLFHGPSKRSSLSRPRSFLRRLVSAVGALLLLCLFGIPGALILSLTPFLIIAVQTLLLISLLIEIIPLAAIFRIRTGLYFFLVNILGDSYSFTESPFRRTAIQTQIRRDLDWLKGRCDSVAVLAHSQGAAVAHLAMKGHDLSKVRLLFTFGSGLSKLLHIEQRESAAGSAQRKAVWSINVMSAVYGLMWFFGASLWGSLSSLAAFSVFYLLDEKNRLTSDSPDKSIEVGRFAKTLKGLEIEWVDVYATMDPVPNGPIDTFASHGPESVSILNKKSVVGDHTSYHLNRDEFFPCMLKAIVRSRTSELPLMTLTPWDDRAVGAAKALRKRRLSFFTVRALIVWISAGALLLNKDFLMIVGARVLTLTNGLAWIGDITKKFQLSAWINPDSREMILGGAIMLGVFGVMHIALRLMAALAERWALRALDRRYAYWYAYSDPEAGIQPFAVDVSRYDLSPSFVGNVTNYLVRYIPSFALALMLFSFLRTLGSWSMGRPLATALILSTSALCAAVDIAISNASKKKTPQGG